MGKMLEVFIRAPHHDKTMKSARHNRRSVKQEVFIRRQ